MSSHAAKMRATYEDLCRLPERVIGCSLTPDSSLSYTRLRPQDRERGAREESGGP